MTTDKAITTAPDTQAKVVESLVLRGDISGLGPAERAAYYTRVCERLGLDPFSQPFEFLRLNGKEIMYAKARATDQLAAIHRLNREIIDGPKLIDLGGTKLIYCVARVTHPNGRVETATATVPFVDPVNVLMKAETKSKRRGTLAILGMGMLDESELETIPADVKSSGGGVDLALSRSAHPSPLALPRDNGPSPSCAPLPTAEAPIVEAPPVALPLSDRDLRAMIGELTSATDLAALRAAWKGMADDEKRGTEEQRAALLDAATKRKAVFAEEARLREERKAAADAEPPNDDGPPKPPRGPRKPRTPVATPDATGGGAEGADGPVDAPGARSSSGHPMTTRAERRAHLATLPLAETVRLSWRHRASMPPPGYREDCALRVCALTHGFGVDDALAYLDAAPLRVVAPQPKTRAA